MLLVRGASDLRVPDSVVGVRVVLVGEPKEERCCILYTYTDLRCVQMIFFAHVSSFAGRVSDRPTGSVNFENARRRGFCTPHTAHEL